ncbi:MAG: hypothetical protein KDD51_14590, partial [Bdellovibrionales bacterium]|nr:hypothetical protein [Bdellovibrionales bacterium]
MTTAACQGVIGIVIITSHVKKMDAFLGIPLRTGVAALQDFTAFCPPRRTHALNKAEQKLSRRVYGWLRQKHNALFLATEENLTAAGALPGPATVLNLRFPTLSRWVLAQARAVVSFQLEPARHASTQGIPVVFVSTDPSECARANAEGIRSVGSLDELQDNFTQSLFCPIFDISPVRPFERPAPFSFCVM